MAGATTERAPEAKFRMRSKSLNTLDRSIVHHMDAAGNSLKARAGVSSLAGGPARNEGKAADSESADSEAEPASKLVGAPCSAPALPHRSHGR